MLVNHLKSKFGTNRTASNKRRRRQAEAVAQIYRQRRDEGIEHVVVLGDFNDTPDSNPLQPLLAETDLTDIAQTSNFDDGDPDEDRPGTFGNGTKSNKIDYLLLSPSLFDRVTGGGIFRKGVWGGTHGTLFPHFDTMTSKCTRPPTTPQSTPTSTSRNPCLSSSGLRFPSTRGARQCSC